MNNMENKKGNINRVEIHTNYYYSNISNHILRDKELSAKALGVICRILSLPPTWDLTISGLLIIFKDKRTVVTSAINELISAGYIVREQIKNEKGQFTSYKYHVYDERQEPKAESPKAENLKSDKLQQIKKDLNKLHITDVIYNKDNNNSGTEKTEIISSDDANQAELETEKDFSNEGTEFVFKDIAVYYCPETGEKLESDNCEVEHLYSKEELIIPQTKQKKLQVKKKSSGANLEKVKKQNCKRVSVKDLDSNLDCVKIVNLYNSLSKDQPTQTIKSFSESLAAEINGMIELYGFDRYYNAVKLLLEDTSFKSSRYLYPYSPHNILVKGIDRLEKFIDLNASEIALQANLNNRYNQFCSEYEKVMGKTYSTKNEISEARLLYFELNEEEKEKALKMLVPVMYHKTMKMNEYLKLKIFMYDKGERTKILGVGSSPFEYCNQY